jgi:hypothetical protein
MAANTTSTAPRSPAGETRSDQGLREWLRERRQIITPSLVLLSLCVVAAISYGPFVSGGRFIADDWPNAGWTRFGGPGSTGTLDFFWQITSFRPGLVLYIPAVHTVFGLDATAHIVWAVTLAVAAAFALYVVLRLYRLPPLVAALPAALVIPFPFADSIRLWSTASMASLVIALYLAGLALALLALTSSRRPVLLHGASVILYALSILTYEVAAPAVALSGFAYLLRVRSRAAVVRGGIDLVLAATLVATVTTGGSQRAQDGSFDPSYLWDRIVLYGRQALGLLGASSLADFVHGKAVLGVTAIGILIVLAAVTSRAQFAERSRILLRQSCTLGFVGLAVIAVGYLGFIPAASFYFPVADGLTDRVNAGAAYGYSMVLAGLTFAIGGLVATAARRPRWGPAIGAVIGVVLLAGFIHGTRQTEKRYIKAGEIQDQVMAAIRSSVRHPPRRSLILAADYPVTTGPNIPSFALSNDLQAAVRLAYDREDLNAMPVRSGIPVTCSPDGVHVGDSSQPEFMTLGQYDRTIFVDVRTRRRATVRSQRQCDSVRAAFPPGPDVAPTA